MRKGAKIATFSLVAEVVVQIGIEVHRVSDLSPSLTAHACLLSPTPHSRDHGFRLFQRLSPHLKLAHALRGDDEVQEEEGLGVSRGVAGIAAAMRDSLLMRLMIILSRGTLSSQELV